jgi:hypothetical protein
MTDLIWREEPWTSQPLPARKVYKLRLQLLDVHRRPVVLHIHLLAVPLLPLPVILFKEHGKVDLAQHAPIARLVSDNGC